LRRWRGGEVGGEGAWRGLSGESRRPPGDGAASRVTRFRRSSFIFSNQLPRKKKLVVVMETMDGPEVNLDRSVSLRLLVLTVLGLGVLGVLVGWGSLAYVSGRSQGPAARLAYSLARFPDQVTLAVTELRADLSEGSDERYYRVPADVDPVAAGFESIGDGILIKVDRSRAARGWRYIGGIFRIDGVGRNAVLLLDPDFNVAALWPVGETHLHDQAADPSLIQAEYRKFIHGLDVLPDGSFAYAFDLGRSVQRMNSCGAVMWSAIGGYNHSVTAEDGLLWTLRDGDFALVDAPAENHVWGQAGLVALDAETGAVRREISIDQLRVANPDISLFDIPRETSLGPTENRHSLGDKFMYDPYHLNDVEPLPAALADQYPQFRPGDLLVSSRTLNTIFVVDPDTLEILWHETGATRRQHDADWGADGRIRVFDNRMGRDFSAIVAIDPATGRSETLFDGARNGFYSYIRGKQARLDNGTLAVVSSQQGRMFEADPATGDTIFELYSTKPDDPAVNYALTSYQWRPESAFSKETFQCNDGQ